MKAGRPLSGVTGSGNVSSVRAPIRITYWALIVLAWLYTVSRAIPLRDGDRGVFASMAERLAAGDTLYVDVWDNKEPLFFLTLAAGRTLSPYLDVVIELLWLVLASIAIYQIARSQQLTPALSGLIGFVSTPIILTGSVYAAGFSHLPASTVLLGIIALALKKHWFAAGLLLPVLAGFKIIMLPIAVVALFALYLLERNAQEVKRVLVGTAVSAAALSALLILRGEFRGFVDLVVSNIGYSQSSISDAYDIPILKHIEPVFNGATTATFLTILVILLITWLVTRPIESAIWWITLTGAATSFLVIAITGLWSHHGQIFYPIACLAAVTLFATIPALHPVKWGSILLVLVLAILLAGAPALRAIIDSGLSSRTRLMDLTRIATPTQELLEVASSGSYHRLGKNTDDSHAYGLENFTLGCYQFVQYTYDLDETLEYIPTCLPTVDYVLVDKGFVPEEGAEKWNTFVKDSEGVLARNFDCVTQEWGRLCFRSDE